ncbi:hypothetical protein SBA4_1460002 [Candidatus Sulfopaludibacter sp. SbA4]|nr:hypothetical protein SBA4_1460002 [Candidatus Sulfopaludibacter sp. SbA4]
MRALLAAVQGYVALGAGAAEVDIRREGRGTVVTARGRHVLNQTRQARAGHVDGRTRALGLGTLVSVAVAFGVAVRIHVPVLSVLAIAVHGERMLRDSRTKDVERRCRENPPPHAHYVNFGGLRGITGGICGTAGGARPKTLGARLMLQIPMYHGLTPFAPPLLTYMELYTQNYPTELHFSRLLHGRVRGSSKWLGLTRSA